MSYSKKLFTGLIVVAFMFGVSFTVAGAQALTLDQIIAALVSNPALLTQLQQTLGTTGTPSTTAPASFSRDLTVGSRGDDVQALQRWLNDHSFVVTTSGPGSRGMESTYFGPATKAAVMQWQASVGLPATGFFGPLSRAKIGTSVIVTPGGNFPAGCTSFANFSITTGMPCSGGSNLPSGCTSIRDFSPTTGVKCDGSTTPGGNDNSGPLSGGAGSVDSYDLQSEFANEDVGEGEEEVKIMSFEVDVDNGSDLDFTSMKVWFENQDTGSSEDLDDFAESVQVWLDGELVGEADVADFSHDDTSGTETDNSTGDSIDEWEKTIPLDGAVVDAGETSEFVVSITAVNNIDSTDHDSDDWDVAVHTVRFTDASGAVINETPSISTSETAFNFGTFATAAGLDMKVDLSDDNPDSHVVDVDATDETEDVELLRFSIEADGSDLTVNDIPFLLTVSQPTVTDDVDFITNNLNLEVDGETYSEAVSTSAGSTATITFDDLGIEIADGDTLEFVLTADINDTQASEFIDGDTLTAQVTVDDIDADDEEGDTVSDGDATGSAVGEAMAFYAAGINASFVSASATTDGASAGFSGGDDTGVYKIVFDVTAFDADLYIDADVVATTTPDALATTVGVDAGSGILWGTTTNSTATTTTGSLPLTVLECAGSETNDVATAGALSYEIPQDETRRCTLSINIGPAGGDIQMGIRLRGISWASDSGDVHENVYSFDMGDYKTSTISLLQT